MIRSSPHQLIAEGTDWLHGRITAQAAHRAAGPGPAQGEGPRTDALHQGREPHADRRRAVALPPRMAWLLRLLRDPIGVVPPRPVDQAPAARHRLEAMEAWAHLLPQRCALAVSTRPWRPKPSAAHTAPGGSATAPPLPSPCPMLSSAGSASPPSRPLMPLNPPNRRVRARTHGGVGGAELQSSPLSRLNPRSLTSWGEAQCFRAFCRPRRPATDVVGWEGGRGGPRATRKNRGRLLGHRRQRPLG